MTNASDKKHCFVLAACGWLLALQPVIAEEAANPRPLSPLPKPAAELDAKQVALGKQLFFDPRLSGDATISCADCHNPAQGWTDGLPLSKGYPGTLYFRNTPTLLNSALGRWMYWDGRLPASDLPTLVRDHIAEAHFFQADGRLVIERIRQVPEYEASFQQAFGGEPTYGRILNSVAGFLKTIRSREVPFDRFLRGDEAAISADARSGYELFRGKAGCIRCHDGPMLSDGNFHNLGLATNPNIFREPERHISFRRFFRTLGVSNYDRLRSDAGRMAVTKRADDAGRFRTPSLREVARTAPYMHDGSLATLEDVVAFYNRGGGNAKGKDPLLKPLGLTDAEQGQLVEFLKSLSGAELKITRPEPPPYQLRQLGEN